MNGLEIGLQTLLGAAPQRAANTPTIRVYATVRLQMGLPP
jgi:hypothetical protein